MNPKNLLRPREFWINPEHNLCLEFGGKAKIGLNGEQQLLPMIHVREVVPIDWNKVWKTWEKDNGYDIDYGVVQDLVEKALKGEL